MLILPTTGLFVLFVPCVLALGAWWLIDRKRKPIQLTEWPYGKPIPAPRRGYIFGADQYYRPIRKPVSGSVQLQDGGSVDPVTGVVTGTAGGTWHGEFHITNSHF